MARISKSIIARPGPPGADGTVSGGAYVPGGTDVAVTDGGTGASTASAARTNLGLGNADNTADSAKPVSTAQQTALNAKQDKAWEVRTRVGTTISTTLATAVNITGFSFAVAAGEVWAYDVYLRTVGNTGGIKYTQTLPAGTHAQMTTGSAASVGAINANAAVGTGTFTSAFNTALYVGWTEIHATISATATGTVQIQFAAGTATESVSIQAGSYMIARRIS